jgi:hypothetical protein
MLLSAVAFLMILILGPYLLACNGGSRTASIEYTVKHHRDVTRERLTEFVSYLQEPGLDNSSGEAPLQVQINFERTYRYQLIDRITSEQISTKGVEEKVVQLYKLPINDPWGTVETARCPISVVIPPGRRATVTVEWTERWAEGVINEGTTGDGEQLGTFEVFLGYIEPCSLVNQENVE